MASCAVNDRRVGYVFAIILEMVSKVLKCSLVEYGKLTDEDGPDVNKCEEGNVRKFLQREDEWEDVVWNTLAVSIKGVESMAGERSRHDPFVMRLVQRLVYQWMMQSSVNQVDEAVGEHDE
jgi:hypothetical protein